MRFFFENKELEKLYQTGKSQKYPVEIIRAFFKKMRMIEAAKNENELRQHKGNHFEKLKGNEKFYALRLNDQYRLEFEISKDHKISILLIQNISKHYE